MRYKSARVSRMFCVFYLLVFGMPADAAAQAWGLHWTRAAGAEGCIDPTSLARRVEALTGPVFRSPSESERFIEGIIERDRPGFRVRLSLSGADRAQAQER